MSIEAKSMNNEGIKSIVIPIPEGVDLLVEGQKISVRGHKGEITRDFSPVPVGFSLSERTLTITTANPRKREIALIGTLGVHIENMLKGVQKGYTYRLKVVYAHFPITVKVQGKTVVIQNFTGERHPRTSKIVGDSKVTVKGDEILVEGVDLEKVSQTAANMELATKSKDKDPRVFLDGIYISEKGEGQI
nr:50S ribosomal protein L6P, large subunit ribosomal protein L6 [uncultured archaeon]